MQKAWSLSNWGTWADGSEGRPVNFLFDLRAMSLSSGGRSGVNPRVHPRINGWSLALSSHWEMMQHFGISPSLSLFFIYLSIPVSLSLSLSISPCHTHAWFGISGRRIQGSNCLKRMRVCPISFFLFQSNQTDLLIVMFSWNWSD